MQQTHLLSSRTPSFRGNDEANKLEMGRIEFPFKIIYEFFCVEENGRSSRNIKFLIFQHKERKAIAVLANFNVDRQQCGCQGLKALIKPILEFLVQQNSSFWFLFQLYGVETVFKGAHFWKQFILKNASKQKAFNDSMTSSSYTNALQGGISAVQI